MQVTNQFGEIITAKIESRKGNKFVVKRFVNGMFMSSYPVTGRKEAKLLQARIIS